MIAIISGFDRIGQLATTATRPRRSTRRPRDRRESQSHCVPARRIARSAAPDAATTARGEQHQQRHERQAVAREHVEHQHAGGVEAVIAYRIARRARSRPRQDRARAARAGPARRSGRTTPSRAAATTTRHSSPGFRCRASRSRSTSSSNLRPMSVSQCAGVGRDEVERAIGPVAGHFRRRQRPSERVFGELGRVLALVLRRAASEAQRHVGAVGLAGCCR